MRANRILIRFGLLFATVAIQSLVLLNTVMDRGSVSDAAGVTLGRPEVQQWISDAINEQVSIGSAIGASEATRFVDRLPESPLFGKAFTAVVGELHDRMFQEDRNTVLSGDTSLQLQQAFSNVAQELGLPADEAAGFTLPVDQVELPNLAWAKSSLQLVVPVASMLSGALLLLGVAIARQPTAAARRVGWGLAINAVGPLLPFVIVPWVMLQRANNAFTQGAVAVMHALGRDLILPLSCIGGIGVAVVVASYLIGTMRSPGTPTWRSESIDNFPSGNHLR